MAASTWAQVEAVLGEYYSRLVELVCRGAISYRSNLLVEALAGGAMRFSRLERVAVTLLGEYSPRVVAPFFSGTRPLEKPFDFEGFLGGRLYSVKVVSGEDAFNSTMRRAVEEASWRHENPVVLTLQGNYFKPRVLGKARWYSAPSTWKMLAGEGGYGEFRAIVYKAAAAHRDALWRCLK